MLKFRKVCLTVSILFLSISSIALALDENDKIIILEKENKIIHCKNAVYFLKKAIQLSQEGAYSGFLVKERANFLSYFNNENAIKTLELIKLVNDDDFLISISIVKKHKVENLKKINPYSHYYHENLVRESVWRNYLDEFNRHLKFNEETIRAIKTGEYYKPGYTTKYNDMNP